MEASIHSLQQSNQIFEDYKPTEGLNLLIDDIMEFLRDDEEGYALIALLQLMAKYGSNSDMFKA